MKTLQINPQNHEIELFDYGIDGGVGQVQFKFVEVTGNICLTEKESEKIGKWFLEYAKQIKKSEASK